MIGGRLEVGRDPVRQDGGLPDVEDHPAGILQEVDARDLRQPPRLRRQAFETIDPCFRARGGSPGVAFAIDLGKVRHMEVRE